MTGVLAALPSPPPSWVSLEIGGATFHPYVLFVLIAIAVATWMADRRLAGRGAPRGQVLDVVVWAVPLGLVGARLAHVVTSPRDFFGPGGHPVRALFLWNGGLEMWGALLLGGLGAWIGCRRAGIAPTSFLDAAAPGLLVGVGIARVGSWFNQDLVGLPTGLPWGVEIDAALRPAAFPDQVTFQPLSLYEALWVLLAAVLLTRWERRARRGPGTVFLAAATLYALGRLWIDPLRAEPAAQVLGLPATVVVSLMVLVLGVAGLALTAGDAGRDAPVSVGAGAPGVSGGTAAAPAAEVRVSVGALHGPSPGAGPARPGSTTGGPAHDLEPPRATALPAGTSDADDGGPTTMTDPTPDPTAAGPVRAPATDAGHHDPALHGPSDEPAEQDPSDEVDGRDEGVRPGGAGVLDGTDRPGPALERAEREPVALELARSEQESAEDEAERAAASLDQALAHLRRARDEQETATSRRAGSDRSAEQAAGRAAAERATARAAEGEAEQAASERAAEQVRRAQEQRAAADAELTGARDAADRATEALQEAEGTAEHHRQALERARRTADERAAAQASLAAAAREAQRAEQEEADHLAQEVQRADAHATQARLAGAEAEAERVAAERAAATVQQDAERAEAGRAAALAAVDLAAQEGVERAAAEARRTEQAETAAAADLAEVERAQAAAQGAEAHEELVRSEAERATARTERLAEDGTSAEAARTAAAQAGQPDQEAEEPTELAVVRHAVEAAEAAEAAAATAAAEREAALLAAKACDDAVSAATERRREAEEEFTRTEHLLAERVARTEEQQEVERAAVQQAAAERLAARAAAARRAGLAVQDEPPVSVPAVAGGAPGSPEGKPSAAEHDEGHAPGVPRRRARSWLAGRFADAARRLEDGR